MAQDKVCLVCGKEYKFCNNCAEYKNQPMWKNIYCSEQCKDIAGVVDKYRGNKITAEELMNKLDEFESVQYTDLYQGFINPAIAEVSSKEQTKTKQTKAVNFKRKKE